jgi:tripartite-type tricarboxylate transporter receptor subunit TctC
MKLKINWKVILCIMVVVVTFVSPCIGAEDPEKFPSKPIEYVVVWSPGGNTDLSTRKLCDLAGPLLGQKIVVVNKAGGGGSIGTAVLAKADPDGYTIGSGSISPLIFGSQLRKVPYHPKKDFAYIANYLEATAYLGVLPDAPWKTFKDFVEDAKRNPGKLTYSTAGPTTVYYFCMETILSMAGVKVSHVPGKGGQDAVMLGLGGHTTAVFAPELIPQIRAGKIRPLAVLANKRRKEFPSVPTFSELGYAGAMYIWSGIAAPKGLDPRIHKKLYDAFEKAFNDPSFQEFMDKLGLGAVWMDSLSFEATIFRDYDRVAEILKRSKPEKQ